MGVFSRVELQPLAVAPPDLRASETRRRRRRLLRRSLRIADVIGLGLAFGAAEALFRNNTGGPTSIIMQTEVALFLVSLPGWIAAATVHGLYGRDEERAGYSTVDDLVGVFHLLTVGTWAYFAVGAVTALFEPDPLKLATFWSIGIVAVVSGRVVARSLVRRRVPFLQNTLIVGAGEVGQLIARRCMRHPESGIHLVGFVDSAPQHVSDPALAAVPFVGSPEDLPDIIGVLDVERVVIAFAQEPDEKIVELVRTLKYLDVEIDIVPRLFELVGPRVEFHDVGGFPLMVMSPMRLSRTTRAVKRTIDVCASAAVLLLLLPFFVIAAAAIKLDSRGPVFFSQVRMGAGDRTFNLLKFRTMVADAEAAKRGLSHLNIHANEGAGVMFKIPDDPRVTRVGRFLRRYFLDEFPQLINVLRGEMSLVGPRPLVLDEDQHVSSWARRRLDVKPGMTGLWQVAGRSVIPFEEMIRLDYIYVTNWSLAGDLRLLLQTVPLVFRGESRGF